MALKITAEMAKKIAENYAAANDRQKASMKKIVDMLTANSIWKKHLQNVVSKNTSKTPHPVYKKTLLDPIYKKTLLQPVDRMIQKNPAFDKMQSRLNEW